MSTPEKNAYADYIVDMLEQLSDMARRDGRAELAARIDTVISAEQSDTSISIADAQLNRGSKTV